MKKWEARVAQSVRLFQGYRVAFIILEKPWVKVCDRVPSVGSDSKQVVIVDVMLARSPSEDASARGFVDNEARSGNNKYQDDFTTD